MPNKEWLDELLHRIRIESAIAATVTSTEVNLDLPRGYVAHFKHIEWILYDNMGQLMIDATARELQAAFVKDPDDEETVEIPHNESHHDVLDEFRISSHCNVANTSGVIHTPLFKQRRFTEEEDAVSARNCRVNCIETGGITCKLVCIIDYTIEKVSDNDILNLLDIL